MHEIPLQYEPQMMTNNGTNFELQFVSRCKIVQFEVEREPRRTENVFESYKNGVRVGAIPF